MIETGLYLCDVAENQSPEMMAVLVRLLKKHPDVELKCIVSPGFLGEAEVLPLYELLQGETEGIRIVTADDDIDLGDLDLLIGSPEVISTKLPAGAQTKTICYGGNGLLGVCEFNRKAMVRAEHAGVINMPEVATLLGALALMPLAKNLMLNAGITGTMLLPSLSGEHAGYRVLEKPLSLKQLSEELLQQLQNSFNSVIEVNAIETSATNFACAVLNVDFKMPADQALELYKDFYSDHRHVFFPKASVTDSMVLGTNKTAISLRNDSYGRLVITTGFDALYKGGAGNIVHIINLLFGLDERTGL